MHSPSFLLFNKQPILYASSVLGCLPPKNYHEQKNPPITSYMYYELYSLIICINKHCDLIAKKRQQNKVKYTQTDSKKNSLEPTCL